MVTATSNGPIGIAPNHCLEEHPTDVASSDALTAADWRRPRCEKLGRSWAAPLFFLVSVLSHAALLCAVVLSLSNSEPGGGGVVLDAISVEIVMSDTLESFRPTVATASSASSISPEVVTIPSVPDGSENLPPTTPSVSNEAHAVTEEKASPTEPAKTHPLDGLTSERAELAVSEPSRRAEPVEPVEASIPPTVAQPVNAPAAAAAPSAALSKSGSNASEGKAAASPGQIAKYALDVRAVLGRARPKGTRDRGKLIATFEIGPDGRVVTCIVTKGSGSEELDRATTQAIRALKFPEPPAHMTTAQRTFSVPFEFR